MKRIELKQISRHYGRHFALHRLDMTLRAGEITGIMGANGAGKTTLLNLLAGIEEPSAGTIQYDSWSWARFATKGRRRIGWISHAPLLYEDLTGEENLRFYAQMYGLDDTEGCCARWLERVGLSDSATKRVEVYSRGMVQRLTIARALLHDPELLLLDEPLTGLDRAARAQMGALLLEERARGKLVVLSTHDLHALSSICDRMVILRKGRLVHEGRAQDRAELIATYERFA